MSEEQRYRIGTLERRGAVAGLRPGQVVGLGGAVGLGAVVLAASPSSIGVPVAALLVLLGACAIVLPLRGRTLEEWAPVLAVHLRQRRRPVLLDVGISEEQGVGIAIDARSRHHLVAEIDSTSIALLDAATRQARVAGFAAMVELLARERSGVDRVSWTVSAAPEAGEQLRRDLRRRGAVDGVADGYRRLLDELAPQGLERRAQLAFRAAAGASDAELVGAAQRALRALDDAGHRRARLLDADGLASLLGELPGGPAAPRSAAGRIQRQGRERFGHLELGDRQSTSWWIRGWPRRESPADLLAPLLLCDAGRRVSVVLEPVPSSRALRRAAQARTSGAADAELRRRGGFLGSRQREAEAAHLVEREAELVDGAGSVRLCGFVSVEAEDLESLAALAADAELAAAQAQLELRRLQGGHRQGVAATWPLADGLP